MSTPRYYDEPHFRNFVVCDSHEQQLDFAGTCGICMFLNSEQRIDAELLAKALREVETERDHVYPWADVDGEKMRASYVDKVAKALAKVRDADWRWEASQKVIA